MYSHRTSIANSGFRKGFLATVLALLAGCSAPATHQEIEDPQDIAMEFEAIEDTLDVTIVDDPHLPAEETFNYAGLDLLFPEIRHLDDLYRLGLEALWAGDLDASQGYLNELDASLDELNNAMSPLASIYFNSLGARSENLRELLDEMDYIETTMQRIDSLAHLDRVAHGVPQRLIHLR